MEGAGSAPIDLNAVEGALWNALGRLSCPVLVLRGGLSSILSEDVAEEMVSRSLRFGRLATMPRAEVGPRT